MSINVPGLIKNIFLKSPKKPEKASSSSNRKKAKVLTPKEKIAIYELYLQGDRKVDIAKKFDLQWVHVNATINEIVEIKKQLKSGKLQARDFHKEILNKINKPKILRAISLFITGDYKAYDIAKPAKIKSVKTLYSYFQSHNLKFPTRKEVLIFLVSKLNKNN